MEEYSDSDDGEEYSESDDEGEYNYINEWSDSYARSTFASLNGMITTGITQNNLKYQANGKAKFVCKECSSKWTSMNSSMNFTYGLGANTGLILYDLYGQQCRRCDGDYELPDFPDSERIRILNKLCLKVQEKFYGKHVYHSYPKPSSQNMTSDHDRSRCQACQLGTCKSIQRNFSQPSHQNGIKTGRYPQVKGRRVQWLFAEKQQFEMIKKEEQNQREMEEHRRKTEEMKRQQIAKQREEEMTRERQQEITKQREEIRQQQIPKKEEGCILL